MSKKMIAKKAIPIMLRLLPLVMLPVLCTACKEPVVIHRTPYLPPTDSNLPSEIQHSVKTDYSKLTPYVRSNALYTRLHDGPLPELVPSQDYGALLPYASTIILEDGGLHAIKYGFVTIDGVVVTDLIYTRVEKAYYYSINEYNTVPAYRLTVSIPGSEAEYEYSETRYAACAYDGSWITAFDYKDIAFSENAIALIREYETSDIDVYDYSGKLLYNTKELDWTNDCMYEPYVFSFAYGISDGYASIEMKNGNYAYIDIMTGQAHYTEYPVAYSFSNGLAAVAVVTAEPGQDYTDKLEYPMLWGFIDTTFKFVIPPVYQEADSFQNERALVLSQNGQRQVIDKRGEVLLTAPRSTDYIQTLGCNTGFLVYSETGIQKALYYTNDFVEITIPSKALIQDGYTYVHSPGEGWLTCDAEGGKLLFSLDEEYFFPDIGSISYTDGEYIKHWIAYAEDYGEGLITLDGTEIIKPESGKIITAITKDGKLKALVVNGSNLRAYGSPSLRKTNTYRLVDTDGTVIASGNGIMTHDNDSGLYSVLGIDRFSWLDQDGNVIINIPLMSYALD